MLFRLHKKNPRDQILHGVYLDNLKTFGTAPSYARRQAVSRVSRVLTVAVLALPALLLGNSGIREQVTPSVHTAPVYTVPAPEVVTPAASAEPVATVASVAAAPVQAGEAIAPVQAGEAIAPVTDDTANTALPNNLPTMRKLFGLSVHTIIIDAGHGGVDPGTLGHDGLQEKAVTLDIALELKQLLEQHGQYHVLMTRDGDTTLPLRKRVAFANEQGADLFISIHVNYLPNKPNNLIETYYYGVPEDQHGINLAERENAASEIPMHEFSDMAGQMNNKLKLEESKRLASAIQKSLYAHMGDGRKQVIDMGIRKAPFVVIMGTTMPAVLAEVTSMSNSDEQKKLRTVEYRREIAAHLEAGIVNYLNKGDYIYEAKR